MDQAVLQRVLACPSLPSLPSVAVQVLDLTANENAKPEDLANIIQFDQALSAKILRTVNSSYYGLRKRCTNIHKALLLLGTRPVRSLALGFSLVSAVDDDDNPGTFDYQAYWRRALFSAVGAKELARALDTVDPDEAFLAGLLQDVGMVAMHQTLGEEYEAVLAQAAGNHTELCRAEFEMLDIQHTDVGAMLAEAWHLPETLIVPIRYHERPTAAPATCAELVRCVALGNLIHDVLTDADPTPALRRLYARGRQWFSLTPSALDDLVRRVADAEREVSSLFSLDTGSPANADDMLQRADKQLMDINREEPRGSYAAEELAKHHAGLGEHDPLTGAVGAGGFTSAVRAAFDGARRGESTLTIAHLCVDLFDTIADNYGSVVRDEFVIGLVAHLHKHFEPMGGVVCRLAPDQFAVVLPRVAREQALTAAESLRTQTPGAVKRWLPALAECAITISAGIVSLDATTAHAFETPEHLIKSAERALAASRQSGGDTVRAFIPAARAA